MPRFDGTGPAGVGPMTGRGRGVCNSDDTGYGVANVRSNVRGRGPINGYTPGFRQGRGLGRGRGPGQGAGFGRRCSYPMRGW